MIKQIFKDIDEEVIRRIYNRIAKRFDEHRMHLPNQWDLVEWPHVKKILGSLKDKRLLDAGCGTGIFIKEIIPTEVKEVVGLDISEGMLKIAKSRCKSAEVKLFQGSIRKVPFEKEYFDIIVAFEVLHYIENLEEVLNEFFRVLKKGNKLIFSIRHPVRNLSYMSEKGNGDYFKRGWHKEKWSGSGNIDLFSFYRPLEEWINILTKSGFNIKMVIESKPGQRVKIKYPDFYSKYIRIPRGLIFITEKK